MTALAWTLLAAALIFLLWRSGLLALMRGVLTRIVPTSIPATVRAEASLAAQALDPNRPETLREFIAAKRATSAEFDAAWKAESKTLKPKSSDSEPPSSSSVPA